MLSLRDSNTIIRETISRCVYLLVIFLFIYGFFFPHTLCPRTLTDTVSSISATPRSATENWVTRACLKPFHATGIDHVLLCIVFRVHAQKRICISANDMEKIQTTRFKIKAAARDVLERCDFYGERRLSLKYV